MITAIRMVIKVSVVGAARALAFAPRTRWPSLRPITWATRVCSSASRFSIFTILMPSRLSITAVDSAEVSSMAFRAALRVRLTKRRMTQPVTGAATKTIDARIGSSTASTTPAPTTVSRFWV